MGNDRFRQLAAGRHAWRFPTLIVLIEHDPTASQTVLSSAIAEDLAYAHSPADAVAALVRSAAFEAAERIIGDLEDAGLVDANWANTELGRIADKQQESQISFEARCRAIIARCQRAGIPRPAELEDLAAFLISGPVLDDTLRDIDSGLDTAEHERKATVIRLIDELQIPIGSPRRLEIDELIERREYVLAERAARRPAGDALYEIPQLGDRPWPYASQTLDAVVEMMAPDAARPLAAQLFVPTSTDVAGLNLLDALRRVRDGAGDGLETYVTAVQGLIGRPHIPRLEQKGTVQYTYLEFDDDRRLPRLVFNADRKPIRFAIGDENGDAEFRLSLRVRATTPDQVVIDVADVLGLLAGSPAGTRDPADRRVLLLRTICRQLPIRSVVDAGSFGQEPQTLRSQLWWLLYLMGFSVDSYFIDALLDLAGDSGAILIAAVEVAVDHARNTQQGLSIAALRDNPSFGSHILTAIEDDIADSPASLVLMCILEHNLNELETLHVVLQRVTNIVAAHAGFVVDVSSALDALDGKGYIRRTPTGFTLGSVGALGLVSRTDIASRLTSNAELALAEYRHIE